MILAFLMLKTTKNKKTKKFKNNKVVKPLYTGHKKKWRIFNNKIKKKVNNNNFIRSLIILYL